MDGHLNFQIFFKSASFTDEIPFSLHVKMNENKNIFFIIMLNYWLIILSVRSEKSEKYKL